MFTFTKTVEAKIAYEVEWCSGKRQDGFGKENKEYFETLKEAQEFILKKAPYTATICKKEFLQKYIDGGFAPQLRSAPFTDIK